MATYLSSLRLDRLATHDDTPATVSSLAPEPQDLPVILSDADTDLYQRIFLLQRRGDFTDADALIAQIENTLLMGPVMAQRLQQCRSM